MSTLMLLEDVPIMTNAFDNTPQADEMHNSAGRRPKVIIPNDGAKNV